MFALLDIVALLPLLLGLLIPYITELVLKSGADERLKSVVNIALSLLLPIVVTIPIVGGTAGILPYFINVLGAWALSGRVYLSKLVPTALSTNTRRDDL